jgi:hypothetical protein
MIYGKLEQGKSEREDLDRFVVLDIEADREGMWLFDVEVVGDGIHRSTA